MRWVGGGIRLLGYVIAGFAAMAAGLQAASIWELHRKSLIAIIVGAAVVTVVGQVLGLIGEFRDKNRESIAQDVRSYLFAMFIDVVEDSKLAARDVGFGAYLVRRRWVWRWPSYRRGFGVRWRWPRPWRRVLMRLDRHRPGDRYSTSRTVWTVGKGVIGQCVKREEFVRADVAEMWKAWLDCTEAEWAAAPADIRMGFTYAEFQRHKGRSGVVLAMPLIRDKGGKTKSIGCVAIDAPAGTIDRIMKPAVRTERHMKDTSSAIANRVAR